MDQVSREIEELDERVEQTLGIVRRLATENSELRDQLAALQDRHQELERRVTEARTRIQSALARLPAAPGEKVAETSADTASAAADGNTTTEPASESTTDPALKGGVRTEAERADSASAD